MSRKDAVWFDQGPLATKDANGLRYEVWANGTFRTTSPDGDYFKGHDNAIQYLESNGITNDDELKKVLNSEEGWHTDMTRWFDLIVLKNLEPRWRGEGDEKYPPLWQEVSCGEPTFEYDEKGFEVWIDEEIKKDAEAEDTCGRRRASDIRWRCSCDRHALNSDHPGPCAAWIDSDESDDGCEVQEE